jgi:hypothetical protein
MTWKSGTIITNFDIKISVVSLTIQRNVITFHSFGEFSSELTLCTLYVWLFRRTFLASNVTNMRSCTDMCSVYCCVLCCTCISCEVTAADAGPRSEWLLKRDAKRFCLFGHWIDTRMCHLFMHCYQPSRRQNLVKWIHSVACAIVRIS